MADTKTLLLKAAAEMRAEGQNGWPVVCDIAVEAIASHEARIAELEGALRESERLVGVWRNETRISDEKRNSAEAEVTRLRAALATIASRADGYTHGDDRVTATFNGIAEIARRALHTEGE